MTERKKVGPKRAKRSVRWQFNLRLVWMSLIVLAVVGGLLAGRHWLQSQKLSSSLLDKAKQAEQGQDREEQIRWLQRYQLLFPDDASVMISLALAADAAVDAQQANQADRADRARRMIGDALSALTRAGDDSPEWTQQENQLRRRLIHHQLQFDSRYVDEAQREIIRLDAPHNDAEMLRSMAIALGHQLTIKSGRRGRAGNYRPDQDFWHWLAQQPVGNVTAMAWRANPNDLTLSAQLIDLCLRAPEQFDSSLADKAGGRALSGNRNEPFNPLGIARQVADHLATMTDSGQAQWVLYEYERQTNPAAAADRLVAVATPSLSRLRAYAQQALPAETAELADSDSPAEPSTSYAPLGDQAASPQWDYDLVLLSAMNLLPDEDNSLTSKPNTEDNLRLATNRLDDLLRLSDLDLAATSIESAYLARGRLSWQAGQTEAALQTWQQGIERLSGDSIKLRLNYASGLVEVGRIEEATQATEELFNHVNERLLALAGPEAAALGSPRQRLDLQSKLNLASWSVWLLQSRVALASGDYQFAVSRLQRALNSQFTVPVTDRIRAASLLAAALERMGNWDLAAIAYERAVYLSPDRNEYRVMAAEAWARAGNSDRSLRQWRAVKEDSPRLAIARIGAIFRDQLSFPGNEQEIGTAAQDINMLRSLIARLPHQDADQRMVLEVMLELLALAIYDRDSSQIPNSSIAKLAELLKQFPHHPDLLSATAICLAAGGHTKPLTEALRRLKESVGENSFAYQRTMAQANSLQGNWQSGVDSLVTFAKANPDHRRECLTLAADLARANGDQDQAYQLLQQVPRQQRTAELLYDTFTLSVANEARKDVSDFGAAESAVEQSLHKPPGYWEQQLRAHEGDSGSWWRLAQADRLLAKRNQLSGNDPQRATLLSQAETLLREIQSARPRWGLAHCLEGRMAVIRGESKLAAEALRRGIAMGDRRGSTLLLLIGQLTQDNRAVEAEVEYSRFKHLAVTSAAVTILAAAMTEMSGTFPLSELDFEHHVLAGLEQAYEEHPADVRGLVVDLVHRVFHRGGFHRGGFHRAVGDRDGERNEQAVVLTNDRGDTAAERDDLDARFALALQRFASVPALVETMGKLQLPSHSYAAAELYQRAK